MIMRSALIVMMVGCYEVCPTGQGPIFPSTNPIEFHDSPATRIVGPMEARSGYDPSWICSCACDQDWAEMWVGSMDDPFDPLPLPWAMPIRDPYTGRDMQARLVVQVGFDADGEALCEVRHGGGLWSLIVTVDDPLQ